MALDITDQTTNGNNLTNHGATEWTIDFPYTPDSEAVAMDNSGTQFLYASDSSSLSFTGDFTLMADVKQADQVTPHSPVSKFVSGGISYMMYLLPAGPVRLYTSSDGNSVLAADSTGTIPVGTWTNIAIAYHASGGSCDFYINGALDSHGTGLATSIFDSTTPVGVGCYDPLGAPSAVMNGKLDNIRVYNIARTSGQISGDYNKNLTKPFDASLVMYIPFETIGGVGGAGFKTLLGVGVK
jgi:hypothetical protein